MSKIAVRRGHQYTGRDGASVGYKKEIDVAELYYKLVVNKFRALGHQVLDVTPPEANRSLSDSLNYGIDMANNWGADYLTSCHVNAFETDVAKGSEVICGSNNGLIVGRRIVSEFVKLGFSIHQGAYMDVRGLAEIKSFKGITLICEPFFCDNKSDVAIYNIVGAEGIADAIVKGITGQTVNVPVPNPTQPTNNVIVTAKPSTHSKPVQNTGNDWIRRLQAECNRQGFSNQRVDGYFGENTVNGCPMMRQGANGNLTRLLQEKLNKLTYNTNGIDGIYGSTTRNAVFNYQKNHGLSADGICGKDTWREIIKQ